MRRRGRTVRESPALEAGKKGESGRLLLTGLIVAAAVLAVFGQICLHGFVSFDDYLHLHDNLHLNPPSLAGLARLWLAPYRSEYVPISYSFYTFEAWLAQLPPEVYGGERLDPSIFHAGSLLLHVATSLSVMALLRFLLGDARSACCGAVLFAIHPLQVESVAWISETRGLLAGLLSILAIRQYLLWASGTGSLGNVRTPTGSSSAARLHRRLQYAFSCCLFVLALLSKSSAVSAVAMAWLLDVGLLHRNWKCSLLALSPWVAASLGFMVLMKQQQPDAHIGFVTPLWARPLVALDALQFYLAKLLAPVGLAIHYDRAPAAVMAAPWFWTAWIVPTAGAAVLFATRRHRWLWVSASVFVAGVLPVLGFLPFLFQNFSTVADRYVYLAMLGPSLALAGLLARFRSVKLLATCLVALAGYGVLSFQQVRHWRNSEALYQRALEINPRSTLANNNLVTDYLKSGDYSQTLSYAQRAVQISPQSLESHLLLALSLSGVGRTDEAIAKYQEMLKTWPESSAVRTNLAVLLYRQGKVKESIEQYRQALKDSPDDLVVHRKLGGVLAAEGHFDEALIHLRRAVELNPRDPASQAELASALATGGQTREAIQHYRWALEQNSPQWPFVADSLARILATDPQASIRNGPEAVRLARAACEQTNYGAAELLATLAAALAESGDFKSAEKFVAQALTLPASKAKPALRAELNEQLGLYRAGKPLRRAPGKPE